jgi:hypothetical protein
VPLPLSEYAMDLAASRVRHCSSIARIELIHYRRAPSHSPNGGVADSLDEVTPSSFGVVDALGENGSGSPVADSSATSASGSHSVAADPVGNQVYVPISNSAAAQASKICSTTPTPTATPVSMRTAASLYIP